ncbi:MAG: hypothetical protein WDZ64_01545 [Parcubacteria group bacterium]
MKKIFITLTIVLAILALSFLGWRIFTRDQDTSVGEVVRNVLPFGTGEGLNIPTNFEDPVMLNEADFLDEDGSPTSNLFMLSSVPVSGMAVFEREGETIVRYIERATGHIHDAVLPEDIGEDRLTKIRVTNTTIPKIYEAVFRPDGGALLLRSLSEETDFVENRALTLTPPTTQSTSTENLYNISSVNISNSISSVSLLVNNLIYFSSRDGVFSTQAFNGTGLRTILTSPFRDWRVSTAGTNTLIHNKASSISTGYAYTLNTTNGALTRVAGPHTGLIAIPSPVGNRVLYSYTEGGVTKLVSRNVQANSTYEITPATLAEKCIWSTRSVGTIFCGAPSQGVGFSEPDNWYSGNSVFLDRIWMHDTVNEVARVLIEPIRVVGLDIDLYQPMLSPSENYLVFINKIDLSLWALKLEDSL